MTDTGQADRRLADALIGYDGSIPTRADVLAGLAGARVFVAVTATSTSTSASASEHTAPATGMRAESAAEMALVCIVASDGERAVPAFADVASLERWRPDVRPVPVAVAYLARAALDDGAAALVLDPDRCAFVVRRGELEALADGYVPVAGAALAAKRTTADALTEPAHQPDPGLVAALAAAVKPEHPRSARLLDGPSGPVLGIVPRTGLDLAGLAAVAQRVMTRLGPHLPDGGLDLAVVPPAGPGYPILSRRGG